jgi:proteasome lid subunit RPN8/RPN11
VASNLILTQEQRDLIFAHAESTYPCECCGALIGTTISPDNCVSEVVTLSNTHEDGPDRRFRIDPKDLLQVERLARKLNASIVGFYHSHPDVAPIPSAYDKEHAWESYSYLIVEVLSGVASQMRSWALDNKSNRFNEQKIVVGERILESAAEKAVSSLEPEDATQQL